jgi:predicted AAA+ superfamily ATPase
MLNKIDDKAKVIIVYGPQACGKTRNKEFIRKFFKSDHVCDGQLYKRKWILEPQFFRDYQHGNSIVILTNMNPPFVDDIKNKEVHSFYYVMSKINL